jgi:molybdate transport system ATP-binding protein
MTVLSAELTRSVPDITVRADIELDDGVTALFGPSGAGKTTLLQCLAGLLTPDEGRIVRDGEVLFDSGAGVNLPPERRRVGFVFQDLRLFPHLTVEENLLYGYRLAHAGDRRVDPERVHELLELSKLLFRRPGTLSGGEARRVALGRAILASPTVLLLDEPLTGLDEARKGAVLDLLGQVRAEFQLPTVFVSHSLSEILELTTRVIVMDRGRVIGQGDLSEVLGTEEVFRLADSLGLESLLEVEITESDVQGGLTRARLGAHEISLPPVERAPGTRAVVAIRPEDVILATAPVAGISALNALAGVVSRINRLSDRVLVSVDVGQTIRAEITNRSAAELGVETGARVHCLVKAFSFRWRHFLPRS